ncbi:MAG: hypothetical protein QGH20_01925 [Candidatus Latescibacteria bacterium]|nr:hypothetical protein [Candidatus Latescibacterota bacterium]
MDRKAQRLADQVGMMKPAWLPMIAASYLIAAGYHGHTAVNDFFHARIELLCATAVRADYGLYLSPQKSGRLPKPWSGKNVYRQELVSDGGELALPSIYDLYAMAHFEPQSDSEKRRVGQVVKYLSHDAFQSLGKGYMWDPVRRSCHSAENVYLACLTPERSLLFTELVARFPQPRQNAWFKNQISELETFETDECRFCFPTEYLKEKRNSYHLYSGSHMGLGENRRKKVWREIESTFRMLNIRRLMKA